MSSRKDSPKSWAHSNIYIYIRVHVFENFFWYGQQQRDGKIWVLRNKLRRGWHDTHIYKSMLSKSSSDRANSREIEKLWVVRRKLWRESQCLWKILLIRTIARRYKTLRERKNSEGIAWQWMISRSIILKNSSDRGKSRGIERSGKKTRECSGTTFKYLYLSQWFEK